MVDAEGVGRSPVEADRYEKGKSGGSSQDRVLLHWLWVNGTSFEWGGEKMA
ncbi:hypothetical protein [Mesorhizobium sp. LNJC405B00]|uniref:hypothetical protein n=1 Tax=Mesorhizobium sp. LNJC405B00 TaxID=1287281 RepID=UPI000A3F915E|nr:hypothetical protein [Mesorhizobium sp. LNJC405B00]